MDDVLLVRIVTSPISVYYLFKNQLNYLRSKQFTVKLITASDALNDRIEKEESCEIFEVPLTRRFNLVQDVLSLFKIYRILAELKPDIVQTQTPKANIIGVIAAWLAGARIRIVTNGGHPLLIEQSLVKRFFFATLEKFIYTLATHVWVNSASIYNMVLNKKLAPMHKVEIIAGHGSSNGIDLKRFNNNILRSDVLKEIKNTIGHREADYYLLAIGRLVYEKGIEELVEVFCDINKTRPDVKLILVGPFEDDIDPIRKDVKDAIMRNTNIIHIDWTDRVEYFFHLADLFIHPSHREGFPQVVLQAGAMKCPVLCSDAPGNIDIILNNEEGIHFKTKDRQDLLKKIIWAMENREKLNEFADNLLCKIEKYYDQEIVHEKMYRRYLQILTQSSAIH